jgi:hypothetical protein
MAKKTDYVDDEEIGTIIDDKISMSSRWYTNSSLSSERERVTRYYNGEYPKRVHDGSSTFVSTDVYDAVEQMRAQLLETFAGGKDIIKFDPQTPEDSQAADLCTKYTSYVVFRQNDGYRIISDAIYDGLTARVGVAKVYWEEREDMQEEEFDDLSEEEVMAMSSQEDIVSLEAEIDEDSLEDQMSAPGSIKFSGKLVRKVDRSQVKIEVVNPEEFSVEPQSKCLSKEYFCVHSTLKLMDDLIREGYPKDKVEKAYSSADADFIRQKPEVLARFQQIDTGYKLDTDSHQDETKWLTVHEAYCQFKRKGDKHIKLYKVIRCGHETLDIEEVDDLPFVAWTPIPIPHAFHGNNYAARVIPYQNLRTALIRSIVDHASVTNNPRYQVLKGGLTNPRELLDNRLGGIVNVSRPDAILPLPQAPLNTFVFPTLELLQANQEKMTGISMLSQGLNKDAVSNQNSQGMIQDLVNMSQTRQKVIARNFANQFIIPLWLKVYDCVVKNESKESMMQLEGTWYPVSPTRWSERKMCSVSLHLGYGELDREADRYAQMAVMWASDPQTSSLFTIENRYKMAIDVAKMRGIANVNDYLTPPNKIPPPQPDPQVMADIQSEQTKAQAALVTAQASMKKVDTHALIEKMRAELDMMKYKVDNELKKHDAARKDLDIQNKVDISQREIALAEEEQENINTKFIVSPNS